LASAPRPKVSSFSVPGSCTGNTGTRGYMVLERSAMGVLIDVDTPPCITLVATVLEATIMAIAER